MKIAAALLALLALALLVAFVAGFARRALQPPPAPARLRRWRVVGSTFDDRASTAHVFAASPREAAEMAGFDTTESVSLMPE